MGTPFVQEEGHAGRFPQRSWLNVPPVTHNDEADSAALEPSRFRGRPDQTQRVHQALNAAFGRDVRYVSAIGLSQIADGEFLRVHVTSPRRRP